MEKKFPQDSRKGTDLEGLTKKKESTQHSKPGSSATQAQERRKRRLEDVGGARIEEGK